MVTVSSKPAWDVYMMPLLYNNKNKICLCLSVSWSPCVFVCTESLQDSLSAQAESSGITLSISLPYPRRVLKL